jgi:hypothetical protein
MADRFRIAGGASTAQLVMLYSFGKPCAVIRGVQSANGLALSALDFADHYELATSARPAPKPFSPSNSQPTRFKEE